MDLPAASARENRKKFTMRKADPSRQNASGVETVPVDRLPLPEDLPGRMQERLEAMAFASPAGSPVAGDHLMALRQSIAVALAMRWTLFVGLPADRQAAQAGWAVDQTPPGL